MTMSRKDYEAVASAIHSALLANPDNRSAIATVVNNLLPHLKSNGGFIPERFIKACGLEPK